MKDAHSDSYKIVQQATSFKNKVYEKPIYTRAGKADTRSVSVLLIWIRLKCGCLNMSLRMCLFLICSKEDFG